ncbi:unnamed protein product, partial [Didymodactylos carnosus]
TSTQPSRSLQAITLGDSDIGERGTSAIAPGRMGKSVAMPEVIKALLAALGDEDQDVRYSAAVALEGVIGGAAPHFSADAVLKLIDGLAS